jgi:hypothetical protein
MGTIKLNEDNLSAGVKVKYQGMEYLTGNRLINLVELNDKKGKFFRVVKMSEIELIEPLKKPESKWMIFVEIQKPNKKTVDVEIYSKSGHDLLGKIQWYSNWRQYCLCTLHGCVFSEGCLDDIKMYIKILMKERGNGQ